MKRTVALSAFGALCALLLTGFAAAPADDPLPQRGTVEPLSISVLAFAPDGTLFLGDSKAGAVYAIETTGDAPAESKPPAVSDLETKIAARIGAKPAEVMIHDLAVHPVSQEIFLSVSTGRGDWKSRWELPNHVADANYLLTVSSDGSIGEFSLADVRYARVELPNPVATDKKHSFMKELSLRTDTITDIAYTQGTLFVAGLSNEEFASALWRVPLPFADGTSATTLEIYHGAHGAYETHAPIRTFVPYDLEGEQHIFAAYLCTPLSLFKVKDLETQGHLRGRTIAEFGSGNYPLDMVVAKGETSDRVIIANSNLPLIVVDTKDIAGFDGEIIEQPSQYAAGVKHLKRSGTGVQQLDLIGNDFLVLLQRMPNGHLDLAAAPLRRI